MAASTSYARSQVVLHWVIALLVAFQILFSGGVESLWRDRMTGAAPNVPTPTPHTVVGIVILLLMLWRLWLRVKHGAPPPPAGEKPAFAMLAKGTHVLFYVLLIGMPISGAVAWFGGIEAPAEAHAAASSLLILLILLHIAAAVAHKVWFRTDVLERMTRLPR
jgi:cytochrome b561